MLSWGELALLDRPALEGLTGDVGPVVLLASDVLFGPSVVKPFFQSIKALLDQPFRDSDRRAAHAYVGSSFRSEELQRLVVDTCRELGLKYEAIEACKHGDGESCSAGAPHAHPGCGALDAQTDPYSIGGSKLCWLVERISLL